MSWSDMRWLVMAALVVALPSAAQAQETSSEARPSVRGGIDDKPFITGGSSNGMSTSVGGYGDVHFRYERSDGATEALSFVPERFNLFTFSTVGDRIRVALELEIEHAGEEIKLELAVIDFEIHEALSIRAGIILAPLGRFNIAHDAPANELTDRPLVSTDLIGATHSQAGIGFYGAVHPYAEGRISYEVYAVNGLSDGVIVDSPDGTRVSAGKDNFEDNDNVPSVVGRVGFSPRPELDLGISGSFGSYNEIEGDGLVFDERRFISIAALDWDIRWWRFTLLGEFAWVKIDLPETLRGFLASQQRGVYVELATRFLDGAFDLLPASSFNGTVRFDAVDYNMDIEGESTLRATAGVNFRPRPETAFKLDYMYGWNFDAFDVLAPEASLVFSVASYF